MSSSSSLNTDPLFAYRSLGGDPTDLIWTNVFAFNGNVSKSDSQLTSDYINSFNGTSMPFARSYERYVHAIVKSWYRGDQTNIAYFNLAVKMIAASLNYRPNITDGTGNLPGQFKINQASESDLYDTITLDGAKSAINYHLRDACLHFAQLGILTNDASAIRKASSIMSGFADKIRDNWPVWNPYFGVGFGSGRLPNNQNNPASYQLESSSGIWGGWIYYDLNLAMPLVEAWSLIKDNPNCTSDKDWVKSMFNLFLQFQTWRRQAAPPTVNWNSNGQPDYSNQDMRLIKGYLEFGILLEEPELVHYGVWYLKNIYRGLFTSDGWWHEGAPAYQDDLQRGLNWAIMDFPGWENAPYRYSDPPGFIASAIDGTRFDNINLYDLVSRQTDRSNRVFSHIQLFNGFPLCRGDSNWNQADSIELRNTLTIENSQIIYPAASKLFGTGCLAILGNEKGSSSQKDLGTVVSLEYGSGQTHSHADSLHLNVFSKNQEVMSETQYNPVSGDTISSRAWQSCTASHNTVVVNQISQNTTGAFGDNRRTKNALDEIDGMPDWAWRFYSGQRTTNYGKLRLYNKDYSKVKVMEVDAEKSYNAVVSPMTKYRRTVSLVEIDTEDNYIVDIFRVSGGTQHDYMLHSCLQTSYSATINAGVMSSIASGQLFPAANSASGMNLIVKNESFLTSNNWNVEFLPSATSEDWKQYTYMIGQSGSEIIKCTAPSMRIANQTRPFICVRRTASESVFVAVHHAVKKSNSSKILSIQSLPSTNSNVIALKINLTNGRSDTVISGEGPTDSSLIDNRIQFTGSFAHVAEHSDSMFADRWLYLVDGSNLSLGSNSISENVSYSGTISHVYRIEDGDVENSFETNAVLPTWKDFQGYTLLIDPQGLPRWSYSISSVRFGSSTQFIRTDDEPGIKIESDAIGPYCKQKYFPNWGERGSMQFKIPGSALLVIAPSSSSSSSSGSSSSSFFNQLAVDVDSIIRSRFQNAPSGGSCTNPPSDLDIMSLYNNPHNSTFTWSELDWDNLLVNTNPNSTVIVSGNSVAVDTTLRSLISSYVGNNFNPRQGDKNILGFPTGSPPIPNTCHPRSRYVRVFTIEEIPKGCCGGVAWDNLTASCKCIPSGTLDGCGSSSTASTRPMCSCNDRRIKKALSEHDTSCGQWIRTTGVQTAFAYRAVKTRIEYGGSIGTGVDIVSGAAAQQQLLTDIFDRCLDILREINKYTTGPNGQGSYEMMRNGWTIDNCSDDPNVNDGPYLGTAWGINGLVRMLDLIGPAVQQADPVLYSKLGDQLRSEVLQMVDDWKNNRAWYMKGQLATNPCGSGRSNTNQWIEPVCALINASLFLIDKFGQTDLKPAYNMGACLLGFSVKNQFTDGGFAEGWGYAAQCAPEMFFTIERMNKSGDFRIRDAVWSSGFVNNYWNWFTDHMLPGNYIANYSDCRKQQVDSWALSTPYRDLPSSSEACNNANKIIAYNNFTFLFPGNAGSIDGINCYSGKKALTLLNQGYNVNSPILNMSNFKNYTDSRIVFWRTGRAKPSDIDSSSASSHFALWVKGGSLKDGHKHRDEGQFAIYCGKKSIILESGIDYDIISADAEALADQRGHSILQIGAKAKSTLVNCPMTVSTLSQTNGDVSINLNDSYVSSVITSCSRRLQWSHSGTLTDPLSVTVTDSVVFAAAVISTQEIFRFHTGRSTNSSGSTNPLTVSGSGVSWNISWPGVTMTILSTIPIVVANGFAMDFTQLLPSTQSSINNPRYHRIISIKPVNNISANSSLILTTSITANHDANGG